MLKLKKSLFFLLLIFSFVACKKTETVIIDNNKVPYYEGVTTVQIQNYVVKGYIDLLGREPSVTQRDNWVNTLKTQGLDSAARANFISSLQADPDYRKQFDQIYIAPMFGGVFDTLVVTQGINELLYFRSLAVQNGDSLLSQFWAYEIQKMALVRSASWQFSTGAIGINEFRRRVAHNFYYDQINMGSENFIVSCFENFLKRLPTNQEKNASVRMVDGTVMRLFLQDGSSKGNFLQIMVNYIGFYEGLAIDTYWHLLLRSPNSVEMGNAAVALKNGSLNMKSLQIQIATSKEYAGF